MKKGIAAVLSAVLMAGVLAACGGGTSSVVSSQSEVSSAPSSSTVVSSDVSGEGAAIRVAGLKGPTTMGLVKLMQDNEDKATANTYEVEMFGAADEVNTRLIQGELDVAAVPANVASVLYNKTQGKIQVAAINTMGVLYVVDTAGEVASIEDLRGKTIYSTGKGQTPEFALNYILRQNDIDPATDVTIEYKSEATEVAAMLAAGEGNAIAVLPQPYATAVQMQNENVKVALNLTEEWDKVSTDSQMVTGVLVARTEFIEQNPDVFATMLQEYEASINWVNENTEDAAELVAKYGIVEKAPVAAKALPYCNLTYIGGEQMQADLSGYLQVLFDQNPEAVGGAMPADDFYYIGG